VESLDTPVQAPASGPGRRPRHALVLGRYRLIGRLGAGGFGVVWRAYDELLDRDVAVKRVPLPPGEDRERATREALAAARLSHPAIVALYEASHEGDAFYLVSELVQGATLGALMAADALSDREIVLAGVTLTDALAHAHARGVIHRDVKPQNVLVPEQPGDGGLVKLTDFGGARLSGEETLTHTGDVVGTLAYMAPEQAEGREVAEPADLYSTALVLYEALAGVHPVRGPTPAATARRIGRPLPPLRGRRADLPTALTAAIDVALLPQPGHRGTVRELHSALAVALEELGDREARRRRRARRPLLPGPSPPTSRSPPQQAPPPHALPSPERPPDLRLRVAGALAAAALTAAALATLGPASPVSPALAAAMAAVAVGALPRVGWLVSAAAIVGWLAAAGRPGTALVVFAAVGPAGLLVHRPGARWSAVALAPALGAIGLAGAFPALAGQARGWVARAALGALGYWWLVLAETLLGRKLWLGPPPGVWPSARWESSLAAAASHAVWPLLSAGVLLGGLLWALGAVLLPWIVRGRAIALDVVAATMWAAALASTAPLLDRGLGPHGAAGSPRGAAMGAAAGAVVAVLARALSGPP
jgi:hypothetical protein